MIWNRIVTAFFCVAMASGARTHEQGDTKKGLSFARETCAECHGVLVTDRVSPRPDIATFNAIGNTPGMTGTAVSVWLRTPHKSMPDLIIETEDRTNVIAYILSLRIEPMPR